MKVLVIVIGVIVIGIYVGFYYFNKAIKCPYCGSFKIKSLPSHMHSGKVCEDCEREFDN